MHNYLRILLLFCSLVPVTVLKAQIDDVSFEYEVEDLSSYQVIFRSFYRSGTGPEVFFAAADTLLYSFEWDFGDGNTGGGPVAVHSYASTGTYNAVLTVTSLTDPGEVFVSAAIPVTVDDSFEVPNVFTPDGDGINDSFIVRSDGVTPLTVTIIDRGGTVVYKHTAPVINWDGRTAAGTRVSPGVYFYVITSSEPLYNKTGFVHILYSR